MPILLAAQNPPWWVWFIFIGSLLTVGYLVLLFLRRFERAAAAALERRRTDLAVHETPQVGDVIITYETYHGFVAWLSVTRHQYALPPDDARKLLGRLLRFNLTWGLFTHGTLLALPLALLNYRRQLASVADQEVAAAFSPPPTLGELNPYASPQTSAVLELPEPRRSLVFAAAGVLLLLMAAGSLIMSLTVLASGKLNELGPGLVGTALFGWLGYSFLFGKSGRQA